VSLARFKNKAVDPSALQQLSPDNPALREGRTIFPSTVVGSFASPRLLVSGHNNPKLGKAVTKGERRGWPIFHLTLEERATCPRSCAQWSGCYGNAMHMARRHRHDAPFLALLKAELTALAAENPRGFMVRLHTLGDFYSVAYLQFWADMLDQLPALHVFGFTARREDADDAESRRIAKGIRWLTGQAWDQFAIRFSRPDTAPQSSIVLDADSDDPAVIMCPAQKLAPEACASCGLCWAPAARDKTIGFLRHGMKRRTPAGSGRSISPQDPAMVEWLREKGYA